MTWQPWIRLRGTSRKGRIHCQGCHKTAKALTSFEERNVTVHSADDTAMDLSAQVKLMTGSIHAEDEALNVKFVDVF